MRPILRQGNLLLQVADDLQNTKVHSQGAQARHGACEYTRAKAGTPQPPMAACSDTS